jgi:hypothetical protein
MEDKIHPVVELLAARMESNPEEFAPDGEGRWAQWLDELIPFVTEAERVMLRGPMMQTFHEQVLDELMNGPDKRRKEAEDREYELHLAHAVMQQKQQALAQQQKAYVSQIQGMAGQLYGGGGGGGGAGIVGKSHTRAIMDEYDYDLDRYRNAVPTLYGDYGSATSVLPVANGGTNNTIINQIKNMLKRGK